MAHEYGHDLGRPPSRLNVPLKHVIDWASDDSHIVKVVSLIISFNFVRLASASRQILDQTALPIRHCAIVAVGE